MDVAVACAQMCVSRTGLTRKGKRPRGLHGNVPAENAEVRIKAFTMCSSTGMPIRFMATT